MLTGHADEIGFMVTYIDEKGFVHFNSIGSIDPSILPGHKVNLYNYGKRVRGVIGKKPIHIMDESDKTKIPKIEDLWIDIGATNRKDAEKRVVVGNCGTFENNMEMLSSDLVTSRGTDNKVGVFIIGEVMRRLESKTTDANIFAVSSVQEEVGHRGARTSAFSIDPHVGIVVDVTVATDHPEIPENKYRECFLGKGPSIAIGANINPGVFELLKESADSNDIPFQIDPWARITDTDAEALQVTRAGVATGLVSVPNRYMHTPVEVVSLKDLDGAVDLLVAFAQRLNDQTNLIPGI